MYLSARAIAFGVSLNESRSELELTDIQRTSKPTHHLNELIGRPEVPPIDDCIAPLNQHPAVLDVLGQGNDLIWRVSAVTRHLFLEHCGEGRRRVTLRGRNP